MPRRPLRSVMPMLGAVLLAFGVLAGTAAAQTTVEHSLRESRAGTSGQSGEAGIGERVASKHVAATHAASKQGASTLAASKQPAAKQAASLFGAPAPQLRLSVTPPKRSQPRPAMHTHGPLVDRSVNCTKVKCVALTFDDGPGPGTPRILAALKKSKAKATFFVLGEQARKYPETVRATARSGMEIGNHTWDHPQLSRTERKDVRAQIVRTQREIKRASGVTPMYLRPPYGDVSKKQRQQLSMPLAFWDVDTEDWKTRSTRLTVASAAAARPGDIVLMHDIHSSTVDAVPQIIAKLQKRGFHLVTLSTLVGGRPDGEVGYGAKLRPGTQR